MKLLKNFQMPNTCEGWINVATDFQRKWNFPNCVGAVDGKHVRMRAPPNTGSVFFNYKSWFSIVLMAVVDANYKFLYCDVGSNGRVSDGGVFGKCSFFAAMNNGSLGLPPPSSVPGLDMQLPFMLVADDAFPLRKDLMKPYSSRGLSVEEKIFNYRLSRARRVVENAFGILASRFRVFLSQISLSPDKVELIVLASCALHNYLRTISSCTYTPPGSIDTEDPVSHTLARGSWRNGTNLEGLNVNGPRNYTRDAKEVRDQLKTYFCTPRGEVSWQYRQTERLV